ncbi:MAG TPA: isochorismatase family cysteine hydrolase [Candidatus Thermoplasmatota archaeon]
MAANHATWAGDSLAATALLVVDMVHDFVDGALGTEGARRAVPAVARVLEEARSRGVAVFFVQDAHEVGDLELEVWGPHAMAGTRGARTVPELAPRAGERVLPKRWYNAFTNPELERALRAAGVDHVVIVGVSTDICVQNTCAGAFFRGIRATVVRDATASLRAEDHAGALEYMQTVFAARIATADEAFRAPAPGAPRAAPGTVA